MLFIRKTGHFGTNFGGKSKELKPRVGKEILLKAAEWFESVLGIWIQIANTKGLDELKSLRSWDFISLTDKSKNF